MSEGLMSDFERSQKN